MFLLREYVGHVLIGTPLERPTRVLRDLTGIWQQLSHPELKELYVESWRMEQVIRQAVKDPMNCIDVGSHLGSMISIMKQMSPNGKHIAVEPIPYKANWLKRRYPEVEVLQIALSDQEGEGEFFFQDDMSARGGLLPHASNKKEAKRIKVKSMRIDDIVPQNRPIGFMKVVAVGAELAILRGSEQVIQRDHPIILFDCILMELENFGVDPKDFYDFLVQKHSYSVFLLKDWLVNKEPISFEVFEKAMQYPFQAYRFVAAYNG
ncbi:MAG: FkbM family methyltransferase [Goleter apudmare HA4340-LM2]|jgi:FkbM family methyltransferase|nr:FkbM family methyltransferase [Goleter apudmare HA4340-LM2]